jgi:hypothetical protein
MGITVNKRTCSWYTNCSQRHKTFSPLCNINYDSIMSRIGEYIKTLTHSLMKLSPSWEAVNCAATQELPSILWNPKVHYRVHKSLPPVPILCQINPNHTIPSHLSRSILILSTHLRLDLPSDLFPSGFPTNILYAFLFSPFLLHACPSHPPWLDHSNYTWRKVKVMKYTKTLTCVNPLRHLTHNYAVRILFISHHVTLTRSFNGILHWHSMQAPVHIGFSLTLISATRMQHRLETKKKNK